MVGTRASWHAIARRLAHFSSVILKPDSRGQVSLMRKPDGQIAPLIEYNLLGDERDQLRLRDGLTRIGALVSSPQYEGLIGPTVGANRLANAARFNANTAWNVIRASALAVLLDYVPGFGDFVVDSIGGPGGRLVDILSDKDRCEEFIAHNTMPLAHHGGTCRIGPREDPRAVVDPAGAVHGVPGLRVVDASVMPSVPRANTNLPVLMIAEKMSTAILGGARS
jgi:5-(hydroxymethyl)furfural/furfural oxidase